MFFIFINNLMGTGWLQKIASNKRNYFKPLKRAMAIPFFFFFFFFQFPPPRLHFC